MKLKEIREAKGISQRQAAIGLNLSPTVYNRYENGLREPSNIILLAMADYFGVSVDELLGRDAPQRQNENEPYRIETDEVKVLAPFMDKMPKDKRELLVNMAKLMFEQYFEGGTNQHDNNTEL